MMIRRLLPVLGLLLTVAGTHTAAEPQLQWTRQLPARKPAWAYNGRIYRDTGYEPVLAGKLVVVGCEHSGAVLAFDSATGEERWRYYTGGPIRVAAAADSERIYAGSDDGHLYCLDHAGKLLWKRRGGPSERQVIGHERLMSAWPIGVRPLLADGKVYCVAGYWPLEGIFVHALDAKTGNSLWTNSSAQFRPAGVMRAIVGTLFVDGHNGNAAFNLKTGAASSEKMPKLDPPPAIVVPAVEGTVTAKAAGEGRLVVATAEGKLYCFGDKRPGEPGALAPGGSARQPAASPQADQILQASKINEGFCLVAGLDDGKLVEGLLAKSKLHVVAVDADAAKVERLRRQLDERGCFDDHRLAVLVGEPAKCGLPPYFASLIVSERDGAIDAAQCLRPYGGVLVQRQAGQLQVTKREGGLAGAGSWTHEMGDPANSLNSHDKLVKAPLGVLWYGGPAADTRYYYDGDVDHQSGHGLNPQPTSANIVEGRMILQGPGVLAAVDIYTGRLLWEKPLPKVYTYGGAGGGLGIHSKNHPQPMKHEPAFKFDVTPPERARSSGFNMITLPDGIYVGAGKKCLRFDPADGKLLSEWLVPLAEKDLSWGSLRASGNLLVATAFRTQDLLDAQAGHDGNGGDWAGDRVPMTYLLVLDRQTGKLLWSRKANWGYINRGGVAIGGGAVYCVDLVLDSSLTKWKESGRKLPDQPPMVLAFDLESGKERWSHKLDVLVKNIVYSNERDLLVAPCRNQMEWKNGDWIDIEKEVRRGNRGRNAPGRMFGFQGKDGKQLWMVEEAAYFDPHVLIGDLIVDRDGVTYDLKTGKRAERISPLTGQPEAWSFKKGGCNHLIACDNLVTWRTAFYDLAGASGVMGLKGMDAGCTPTLLPAGGILSIPNFGTHHKRNRMTAMALVHVPDNQLWTQYDTGGGAPLAKGVPPPAPVALRRAGFNFGAPGDRRAEDGTLWLAVGAKGGNGVVVKPKEVDWFTLHPSQAGSFVGSSGLIGAGEVSLPVVQAAGKNVAADKTVRKYDVRLHFIEPAGAKRGERVFTVSLEGKPVLADFDITKEAGGATKTVMREFKDVEIIGLLDIVLTAGKGVPVLCGVELTAK